MQIRSRDADEAGEGTGDEMQIMLPAEEVEEQGRGEEARRRCCCVRSGTCELICWVVCSKSIAALQSITNDTQDTPRLPTPLSTQSACACGGWMDGWRHVAGCLFCINVAPNIAAVNT